MSHRFLKKTRKVSLIVLKKNKNREYKYLNYLKKPFVFVVFEAVTRIGFITYRIGEIRENSGGCDGGERWYTLM